MRGKHLRTRTYQIQCANVCSAQSGSFSGTDIAFHWSHVNCILASIALEEKGKVILFTSSASSWAIHSSVSHLIFYGEEVLLIANCLYYWGWLIVVSAWPPYQEHLFHRLFTLSDNFTPEYLAILCLSDLF